MKTLKVLPFLLLMAGPALAWDLPIHAPKLALAATRPCKLLHDNNRLEEDEVALGATYDLISSAARPEEIIPIRQRNPRLIGLFNLTLRGIYEQDQDHGFRMPAWQRPDTMWSVLRTWQYWYEANLDAGVDWAHRRVDGTPVVIWNMKALDFTSHCPRGVCGPTRGLTFSEYARRSIIEISRRSAFRAAWDGWWIDTVPPECWIEAWKECDWTSDGYAEGCPKQEEEAAVQLFLDELIDSLQQRQLVVVGQKSGMAGGLAGVRANGRKLEDWGWQYGASPWWIKWWTGDTRTTGYLEAELVLRRYTPLPCFDPYQGWDLSVLEAVYKADRTDQNYLRYALATSLLGDGFYACETYATWVPTRIPEMASWDFALPALTEMYWAPHPRAPGWRVACRQYRWRRSGAVVTVVADTLYRQGYLVNGAWR